MSFSTSAAALNQKLTFLNESPLAWFVFIGMLLVILWVWGSMIKYLSGDK